MYPLFLLTEGIAIKENRINEEIRDAELRVIDEDGTEYDEWEPDESATRLLDVYAGLKPYDEDTDDGNDEAENVANCLYHGEDIDHIDYFTQTKEEGWSGFLSDPKQRGWFLALIKNYCPEKLADIPWAA